MTPEPRPTPHRALSEEFSAVERSAACSASGALSVALSGHDGVRPGYAGGMDTVLRLEPQPVGAERPVGGSTYFIGNATVLLRYRGFTILTDPTFVHRHDHQRHRSRDLGDAYRGPGR